MNRLKLGVVFGGMSTEHDVSVVSGTSIIKNLNREKYEIYPIYIRKCGERYIYVDKNFDEEVCDVDKICDIVEEKLGFPVFVKPSNSGSSVGINKSYNRKELVQHIEYATKFDTKILIEENINGREVECAVLGNEEVKASCVGEILPAEDFYTFDAKYKNSESRVVMPADIPEKVSEKIRKSAIKAFKAVDGKGLSRVDFFLEKETDRVLINEINTLPGFTQISMYPKLWEQMGLSYTELLDRLIELASEEI